MKVIVTLTLLLLLMAISASVATAQVGVPVTLDAPETPTPFVEARNYSEGVLVPGNATAQLHAVVGVRGRITTASTVELAGVIRLEGQTITGPPMLSSDDETVTTAGGVDGQSLTVPRPTRRLVGVITHVAPQTLSIMRDDGSAVTIPRAAIARVEQQIGRRSRWRGAGWGFLIGGGGGAGVGYLIGRNCHSTAFLGCFLEPAASTFGGLLVGGVAGAVLGAVVPPSEQWLAVTANWLDGQRGNP